jgi:hypothetical protein
MKPSPEETAATVQQMIESLKRAKAEFAARSFETTKRGAELLKAQARTHLQEHLPRKYQRLQREGTLDAYLDRLVEQVESIYALGKDLPPSGVEELVREILFEPTENDG